MPGKDATYRAFPGRLGTIILGDKELSPQSKCELITHEFIHVLQHLNGDLTQVKQLGWPIEENSIKIYGSIQEAEAYGHQKKVGEVLSLFSYLEKYR